MGTELTDQDLVDAEREAHELLAAAAELEHLVAEKLRLTVELERMAAERDTARELARDAVAARDRLHGELAEAHRLLATWRESVVAANRISQAFEARAIKAEGETVELTERLHIVRSDRDQLLEMLGEMFGLKEIVSEDPSAWVFGKRPDGAWVVWHEDYPEEGAIPLQEEPEPAEEVGT